MSEREGGGAPERTLASQRLDVWLDVACLYKTRSQATAACKGGKVQVDGQRAKPNRPIRVGETLRISHPGGKQVVEVVGLSQQHLPKAEARRLYADRTPPPTPEELEIRELERFARLGQKRDSGAPDKRERRRRREILGKE